MERSGLNMPLRKILFVTGTRADFGKLKPLIFAAEHSDQFEARIFATGMHTLPRYGGTIHEIYKEKIENVFSFVNQFVGDPMEIMLANTISGLSRYVADDPPDLIVVHGDRIETLAGAIVGALRNIRVAHVEGGELSGTVDELIRHSVSKLAHCHFVANDMAYRRVVQMGENPESVFIIGSPEIDIMLSDELPTLDEVRQHYELPWESYAISLFHPVTTDNSQLAERAAAYSDALKQSGRNYVVVYPNNDLGSNAIFNQLSKLNGLLNFRVFPSIRFESFLCLLKEADFIVGNSSSGVREAPIYGVPAVNVGSRQHNRFEHESIRSVGYETEEILEGINWALDRARYEPVKWFGSGESRKKFFDVISSQNFWAIQLQKQLRDISFDLNEDYIAAK